MKQHITLEQLQKLSDKALTRLSLWMESNNYKGDWIQELHDVRYFPTIGQMIEFLHKYDNEFTTIRFFSNWDTTEAWVVGNYVDGDGGSYFDNPKSNIEICDALWEAVKEVLERE